MIPSTIKFQVDIDHTSYQIELTRHRGGLELVVHEPVYPDDQQGHTQWWIGVHRGWGYGHWKEVREDWWFGTRERWWWGWFHFEVNITKAFKARP